MTPRQAWSRGVAWGGGPPVASDGVRLGVLGLLVRLAIVVWAAPRFPPVEDGRFYHVVATRIASGQGYTWLWPDGAVTYAAHYPVGYPLLVGLLYRLVGEHPAAAMVFNAAIGGVAIVAVHRLAAANASRGGAAAAGLVAALHPGLVFYTPALMTEAVTGSLLVIAAALLARRRMLVGGLVLGVAALVRPQVALLAPLLALLGGARGTLAALRPVLGVTLVVGAVSAPWVLRNCSRLGVCTSSANGGWNLFIGAAPGATGTFVPLEVLGVPPECRTVWGEGEKDVCFGAAGRRAIVHAPAAWLARIPAKLGYTFDYAGAAGWYLAASNPTEFGQRAKVALGAVETVFQRFVVLAGLAALARASGPRRRARLLLAGAATLFLFVRPAWVAHLALVASAGMLGRAARAHPAALTAGATVLGTAACHAVFFGAGRYSLVCFPVLAALAGTAWVPRDRRLLTPGKGAGDTEREKES